MKPWQVSGRVKAAQPREAGHFSLLHTDPLVLFSPDWEVANPASAVWAVLDAVLDRAAYLVVSPSWTLEDRSGGVLDRLRQISQRARDVVVVVSCADANEAAVLQREGLAVVHCSVSALVRDDFFVPTPGRQPRFDAIYDARWTDYKRHDLARFVRSLALIAAPSVEPRRCTHGYSLRTCVAVRHATWISNPWGVTKKPWLSVEEVNAAYNQARVGLCLSRAEGVMFASIQYLLAGLPVVTTRNLGGRDEFFSQSYVRWVDDHPEAVADAVDELVTLNLDPHAIRDKTLAKMTEHRGRMQAWIQQVIAAEGGELGRWGGEWPAGLPNKLREPKARAADVLAEIHEGARKADGSSCAP